MFKKKQNPRVWGKPGSQSQRGTSLHPSLPLHPQGASSPWTLPQWELGMKLMFSVGEAQEAKADIQTFFLLGFSCIDYSWLPQEKAPLCSPAPGSLGRVPSVASSIFECMENPVCIAQSLRETTRRQLHGSPQPSLTLTERRGKQWGVLRGMPSGPLLPSRAYCCRIAQTSPTGKEGAQNLTIISHDVPSSSLHICQGTKFQLRHPLSPFLKTMLMCV